MVYNWPDNVVALHTRRLTIVQRENLLSCDQSQPYHETPKVQIVMHAAQLKLGFRSRKYPQRWAAVLPFSTSTSRHGFHFDTHHFVQRLEREGLNRAQAEGIMSAMAEVIDESIRNMTSNMVTKADQEKVSPLPSGSTPILQLNPGDSATLHPTSGFCAYQIRTSAYGKKRSRND